MPTDQSLDTALPDRLAPARLVDRIRSSQGARSGLGLAVATAIFTGCAYLYNLACIRYLGTGRFGDVATMLSLGTLAALPLGGVQSLLARETAHLRAIGDRAALSALFRRSVKWTVGLSLGITVAAVAASEPIGRLVNVESAAIVAVGLSAIAFFAVGAVLYGFAQGMERFRGLGMAYAVSGMARPILVVPVLLAGLGVVGALGVNVVAAAVAVGVAAFVLRDLWSETHPGELAPRLDRLEVIVMAGGTLAFASLTNIDVVLANALLSDHDGGIYAAAALVAKLVLLVSLVVVTVLLPKATSRAAEGRSGAGILLASVLSTTGLSALAAGALFLVPESLVVRVLGGDFRESAELLGILGVAMVLVGVVNVYLFFYLAHRRVAFPILVGIAAIGQVAIMVAWHPSPTALVWATLASVGTILVIHETWFPHSVARTVRSLRRAVNEGHR